MEEKERLIQVRTADGKPILNLRLIETQAIEQESTQVKDSTSQPGAATADRSSMTDAQKRYLFRIMAEQGMEGDKAHEHLKALFGVDSLQDVGKAEASRMIEHLLEKAEKK